MRIRLVLATILVICALLLPATALAQPPDVPLLFQGRVSIGGDDAPVGTIISAEIGGVEVATNAPGGITEAGRYGIQIESDDDVGEMVVFKVNGVVGGQHEYVDPWETPTVELDLGIAGPETYTLTISSTAGGSVTTPGEGTSGYAAAEVVDLAAEADAGYQFDGWTGDVATVADANESTTMITMDADKSIAAAFTEVGPAGAGGLSTTWIIVIIAVVVAAIVAVFVIRRRRRYD